MFIIYQKFIYQMFITVLIPSWWSCARDLASFLSIQPQYITYKYLQLEFSMLFFVKMINAAIIHFGNH